MPTLRAPDGATLPLTHAELHDIRLFLFWWSRHHADDPCGTYRDLIEEMARQCAEADRNP